MCGVAAHTVIIAWWALDVRAIAFDFILPSWENTAEEHSSVAFLIPMCVIVCLGGVGSQIVSIAKSLVTFFLFLVLGVHASARNATDATASVTAENL